MNSFFFLTRYSKHIMVEKSENSWMNTGTYIGVGGLLVALLLWFTKSVRPMFALAIAAVALGAGWYNQPKKADDEPDE